MWPGARCQSDGHCNAQGSPHTRRNKCAEHMLVCVSDVTGDIWTGYGPRVHTLPSRGPHRDAKGRQNRRNALLEVKAKMKRRCALLRRAANQRNPSRQPGELLNLTKENGKRGVHTLFSGLSKIVLTNHYDGYGISHPIPPNLNLSS